MFGDGRALLLILVGVFTFLPAVPFVLAQEAAQDQPQDADPDQHSLKEEIETIQQDVRAKERNVKQLDEVIARYKARIQQQVGTAASLQKQLDLLDIHILEMEARIARSEEEGKRLALAIELVRARLAEAEASLTLRRALLEQALVRLALSDANSPMMAMLAEGSMSAYVARREEWRQLQAQLQTLTEEVRASKLALEQEQTALDAAQQAQVAEALTLENAKEELEEDKAAKESLLAETGNREEEYRRLVADVAREQQSEAERLASLRDRLQDKLDSADEVLARGDILLQWPVTPKRGISAHFHDETYPFRHLFEHPGTDVPVPVGTPVKAAAGGYVAWNRTGKQYGNYVMIIHPNGIATVYAHLSGFVAKPDTYVERGEIIGYSGGKAGAPGSGLSTGPHLHFEVRQNGVPVNPMLFLPEL